MHGGPRAGAGRPEGGISATRRLLVRALTRGLAIAGRSKGLEGTDDEVATESAARIAADLIVAGRGDEVLKLLAVASPANEPAGGKDGEDSLLSRSLRRLPGMGSGAVPVPARSQVIEAEAAEGLQSQENASGPTDTQSSGPGLAPFFAPQLPLVAPPGEGDAGAPGARELAREARA